MSYSSRDAGWVEGFQHDLLQDVNRFVKSDVFAFFDRQQLQPGEIWPQSLLTAAGDSAILVPILTPRFFESEYCQKEFEAFVASHRNLSEPYQSYILPVRLLSPAPADHPLHAIQTVSFCSNGPHEIPIEFVRGSESYRIALRELSGSIAALLENDAPKASSGKSAAGPGVTLVSPLLKNDSNARENVTASLLSELSRPGSPKITVVTGSPGSGAVSIGAAAVSALPHLSVPINLAQMARQSFWDQSSDEVTLFRCVVDALGSDLAPRSAAAWANYERCLATTTPVRTMVEQSGYGSVRQSLQALLRRGRTRNCHIDPLAALQRVMASKDEIDLVVNPMQSLLHALAEDLLAFGGCDVLFHFHDIEPAAELPLVSLVRKLRDLERPGVSVRVVVSIEAPPDTYPLLRQLPNFHIPRASASEVLRYLGGSELEGNGSSRARHQELIVRLSGASLATAELLRERPRLMAALLAMEEESRAGSRLTAAEAWLLITLAYDVTPALLSQCLGISDTESALLANEIPDEPDGGRRVPIPIAAAVISAAPESAVQKVNERIIEHLNLTYSQDPTTFLPPTQPEISKAFHVALASGDLEMFDVCLLRGFRTSLSLCSRLRIAFRRLLLINLISAGARAELSQRLHVLEIIESGLSDDSAVVRFFEGIARDNSAFTNSQRAVAYYQLGHCYFAAAQDRAAADALEHAIELDSSYYNAWSLLGVVYDLVDKRGGRALSALDQAIRLNGKYDFAHFNRGTILERRGLLVDAAHSYIAAVTFAPMFYEAAYNLSNTLLELRMIRDAKQVAAFTGAMAQELRVEPLMNIATATAGLGDLPNAIKLFRYCLSQRSDSRIAYNLALAYASHGHRRGAEEALAVAARLAEQEGNEKIREFVRDLSTGLRAGTAYNWPRAAQGDPVATPVVKVLRQELEVMFAALGKHGLDQSAERFRRTVADVTARHEPGLDAPRKASKPTQAKTSKAAEAAKIARLPSYCGG